MTTTLTISPQLRRRQAENGGQLGLLERTPAFRNKGDSAEDEALPPRHLSCFVSALADNPTWAEFRNEDYAEQAQYFTSRPTFPGETLIKQGERDDRYFVVLEGEFQVFKEDDKKLGRERKLRTLKPGMSFGELALLNSTPRTASVRSAGHGLVMVITRQEFHRASRKVRMRRASAPPTASSAPSGSPPAPDPSASSDDEDHENAEMAKWLDASSEREFELFQGALAANSMFSAMTLEQHTRMLPFFQLRLVQQDEVVIRQGDPGEEFYVIVGGSFTVTKRIAPAGADAKLATLLPGMSFGELALQMNSPRAATITCTSDEGTLWAISRASFRQAKEFLEGEEEEEADADSEAEAEVDDAGGRPGAAGRWEASVGFEELRQLGVVRTVDDAVELLALHSPTDRFFTLRKFDPSRDAAAIAREVSLFAEHEAYGAISHSAVQRVLQGFEGSPSARCCLLLESTLTVETLGTRLDELGGLPSAEVTPHLAVVVDALRHLHRRKVIHRDVTADNCLLALDGMVRLGGFSHARRCEERARTICGTAEYMAPEMLGAQGYRDKADWWQLGVLSFELSCGALPFTDDDPMNLVRAILLGRFEHPPDSCVPDELRDLTIGLLRVNASTRLSSRDVAEHPFFASIDWQKVQTRELRVAHLPENWAEKVGRRAEEEDEDDYIDGGIDDDGGGASEGGTPKWLRQWLRQIKPGAACPEIKRGTNGPGLGMWSLYDCFGEKPPRPASGDWLEQIVAPGARTASRLDETEDDDSSVAS